MVKHAGAKGDFRPVIAILASVRYNSITHLLFHHTRAFFFYSVHLYDITRECAMLDYVVETYQRCLAWS